LNSTWQGLSDGNADMLNTPGENIIDSAAGGLGREQVLHAFNQRFIVDRGHRERDM